MTPGWQSAPVWPVSSQLLWGECDHVAPPHTVFSVVVGVVLALVQVGTLYLVRTALNCSSVASVRTPVGSKWVRLTLKPASVRYWRNLFSLYTKTDKQEFSVSEPFCLLLQYLPWPAATINTKHSGKPPSLTWACSCLGCCGGGCCSRMPGVPGRCHLSASSTRFQNPPRFSFCLRTN